MSRAPQSDLEDGTDSHPRPALSGLTGLPKASGVAIAAVVALSVTVSVMVTGDNKTVVGQPDQIAADEVARRAIVTRNLTPVKSHGVSADHLENAIAAMGLSDTDRTTLVADVREYRARLITMSFFDSDAEDGDVITVQSRGFSQIVRLPKTPVIVTLPAPIDGSVRVVGTADGGGGVTVGIVTPSGPLALAVLSVGQVITIPVAVE